MTDQTNNCSLVIGERIKQELKRQGKTTVWLAKQLGCHRTNIYKIYSKSTIDTGMLMHICKVIGYNFFDLLSEEYKKQVNLKSASNLNGNLNCSKELEHYAS